jgi:hypothetical protein
VDIDYCRFGFRYLALHDASRRSSRTGCGSTAATTTAI